MKKCTKILSLIFLLAIPMTVTHAFWSKFLTSYKIHQAITSTALGRPTYTFDGAAYAFSSYAVDTINQSHPKADSEPYDARDHFDSESFNAAFAKLVNRREQLMSQLSQPNPDVQNVVWPLLGYALHQIQDFYSHSTWVQRGNKDIVNFGAATEPGATAPNFILDPSMIGSVCAADGATLLSPSNAITTGYYTDGAVVSSPPPPQGKCAHGLVLYAAAVGCGKSAIGSNFVPDGINHDHPCFSGADDLAIYNTANSLAERETESFIQAIASDLLTNGNRLGFCLMLGLDTSKAPCLSDCASQAASVANLAVVEYLGYSEKLLGVTVPVSTTQFGSEVLGGFLGGFGEVDFIAPAYDPNTSNFVGNELAIRITPIPYGPGNFQAAGILDSAGTALDLFLSQKYALAQPNQVTVSAVTQQCVDNVSKTALNKYSMALNLGFVASAGGTQGSATTSVSSFLGYAYVCQKGYVSSQTTAGDNFQSIYLSCH